jgi:hypothetical protein
MTRIVWTALRPDHLAQSLGGHDPAGAECQEDLQRLPPRPSDAPPSSSCAGPGISTLMAKANVSLLARRRRQGSGVCWCSASRQPSSRWT